MITKIQYFDDLRERIKRLKPGEFIRVHQQETAASQKGGPKETEMFLIETDDTESGVRAITPQIPDCPPQIIGFADMSHSKGIMFSTTVSWEPRNGEANFADNMRLRFQLHSVFVLTPVTPE